MRRFEFLIYPEDGDFRLDVAAFADWLRRWWPGAFVRPAAPPLPAWACEGCYDLGEQITIYAPRPAGQQFFLRGKVTGTGIVAWYGGADGFAEFAAEYRRFVALEFRLYALNDLCTRRMRLEEDVTTRQILDMICGL